MTSLHYDPVGVIKHCIPLLQSKQIVLIDIKAIFTDFSSEVN